ncbi:AcrB/AcrD/AcrF family protein [Bacillus cereus]|uniref:AcrB/AcrD/AcrF family protein n=1 Tax=Bacillus TaxID=1386 RepID=UPI0014575CFB|nr:MULTISPECIES: AcrB/AcrD/AcrF family protein [Bacillus]MDA1815016.1 AcrB/AcrD/AcrF family protein [Bacillus cereus]MDA2512649.1 AcrB/AcrD/AcrF family protein [Bacillus cereus]MEB5655419.1 AcrB/AcrD/AcrF family protein [Bacillus anthracis]
MQHVKQLLRNSLYFFFSKQIRKFSTYNLRKKTNAFILIAIYMYMGTKITSILFNPRESYGLWLVNISWVMVMLLYLYFAKNIYFEMKQEHRKVKELTFFSLFDSHKELPYRRYIYKCYTKILYSLLIATSSFNSLLQINASISSAFSDLFSNVMQMILLLSAVTVTSLYLALQWTNILMTIVLILSSVITGAIISTSLLSTIGSLTHFDVLNDFSIILTIFIGIIVQMGIVWIRPPYQLSRTENAFFISNSMIATTLLLLVIFIQDVSVLIGGETNLEKKAQLALLPYTIGATINFMYIKFKSNRIAQKAEKNMLEVIYLLEEHDIDCLSPTQKQTIVTKIKKCVYYGGTSFRLLLLTNPETKQFIKKMKLDERTS